MLFLFLFYICFCYKIYVLSACFIVSIKTFHMLLSICFSSGSIMSFHILLSYVSVVLFHCLTCCILFIAVINICLI